MFYNPNKLEQLKSSMGHTNDLQNDIMASIEKEKEKARKAKRLERAEKRKAKKAGLR